MRYEARGYSTDVWIRGGFRDALRMRDADVLLEGDKVRFRPRLCWSGARRASELKQTRAKLHFLRHMPDSVCRLPAAASVGALGTCS